MKKKKIKLSIIDDYVHIFLIKNFLSNSFDNVENSLNCIELFQSTQQLDSLLEAEYMKIIKKLKLDDASFCVLKKELEQNNYLFTKIQNNNFLNLESTLKLLNLKLKSINNNLKLKLADLKII